MEKHDEEQIIALMGENPELQTLYTEHLQLKKEFNSLNHKHHLTAEQEVDRKRIQKAKLAGKDRMMKILADHLEGHSKAGTTAG